MVKKFCFQIETQKNELKEIKILLFSG